MDNYSKPNRLSLLYIFFGLYCLDSYELTGDRERLREEIQQTSFTYLNSFLLLLGAQKNYSTGTLVFFTKKEFLMIVSFFDR